MAEALPFFEKALAMFKRMSVPVIGVVENMTALACPHCGEMIELFGRGGGERFSREHGLEYLGGVPLDVTVRQGGDVGVPAVAQREPGPAAKALTGIARTIAARMSVRSNESSPCASGPSATRARSASSAIPARRASGA